MFLLRKKCFCAYCKTERSVYVKKHLHFLDVVALIFLSVIVTYTIYKTLDPRGLFIAGLLIATGEFFVQIKRRTSINCSNCGFDPILYMKNPTEAGLKIKAYLAVRAQKPESLLKKPVLYVDRKKTSEENLSL